MHARLPNVNDETKVITFLKRNEMNKFFCNNRRIARTLLLAVLLLAGGGPGATAVWAQSTTVISVKALCAEGDYEWEGLVDSATVFNPEFQRLAAEVRKVNDQKLTNKISQINREDKKNMEKTLADMEKLKKMGMISDAEYQKMRKQLLEDLQKAEAQRKSIQPASQGGSASSPVTLKEQIRQYCLGKRFYRHIYDEVDGMRRVDVGKGNDSRPTHDFCGFIDARTGRIMIAPDRYNYFYKYRFTKSGVAAAHTPSPIRAYLLDKTGRVLIEGYTGLAPFGNCLLIRAEKTVGGKWGIIDYEGNVLEPFVHSTNNSPSILEAGGRIMKEKGWQPVEIY